MKAKKVPNGKPNLQLTLTTEEADKILNGMSELFKSRRNERAFSWPSTEVAVLCEQLTSFLNSELDD